MSLERRLGRLEGLRTRERDQGACPGCGAGSGTPPVYRVVFGEAEGRERCGECGRRLVFRIEFDRSG